MCSKTDIARWVTYEPTTGKLTFKTATPDMFTDGNRHMTADVKCKIWNNRNAGRQAGRFEAHGYLILMIKGETYKTHRLAFLLMTGEMPKGQVDHINGDRADNRWENLRDVPKLLNALNQKRHKSNKSGVPGVRFAEHIQKWIAYIGQGNRMHHLGVFATLEEAAEARWDAEEKLGFHTNHGRS